MRNKKRVTYIFDNITYSLPFGIKYDSEICQPQTIREVFINALIQRQTVWVTGYGQDKHEPHFITEIELYKVTYYEEGFTSSLGSTGPCFVYVWGWPGPDFNVYSLADYGKTWAFTKEELITKENYEANKRVHKDKLEDFDYFFKEETKSEYFIRKAQENRRNIEIEKVIIKELGKIELKWEKEEKK